MLKHWRKVVLVLALLAYSGSFWIWASYDFALEKEICEKATDGTNYNCAAYNIGLIALWKIGEAFSNGSFITALITAIATCFIGYFTYTLKESTDKLWLASEKQTAVAKESADAAKAAVHTASEGNTLTREIFIAEQRPWLLWRFPPTSSIIKVGEQINVRITAEIENIGKTPALNVTYFGKLYFPGKDEAIMAQGISFYAENLRQALQYQFSLAHILPTEKIPVSFSPHGINIASLPSDREFVLCLAFHAKYEFSGRLRQVAEIGAVYSLYPVGAEKITFSAGDFRQAHKSITLQEFPGVRRIT
jgi:hypothetical protein